LGVEKARKCRRSGERAFSEHRSSSLTGSPSQKRIGAWHPTLPALSLSKGQVHAVLARTGLSQTCQMKTETTANLINFHTQPIFWQ